MRAFSAVLSLGLLASPALAADTYLVDKGHSEASFQVRHLVSKVRGRFTDFAGTISVDQAKPETSTVEFTIKATSINTDQEARDKHLRSADFFDVEKFPEITFKSSKIVAKGKDHFDVTGTLTMHGVSKEVTLPVTALGFIKAGQQDKAGFETAVTLNRKDYGITWNRAMDAGGVMLGEDIAVAINIEANKKKEKAPATTK
jgi:polyisoprenoid-binding protein YceI